MVCEGATEGWYCAREKGESRWMDTVVKEDGRDARTEDDADKREARGKGERVEQGGSRKGSESGKVKAKSESEGKDSEREKREGIR